MTRMQPWLLALDTATATVVVAAGQPDGRLSVAEQFEGRYRHSQELLPAVVRVMDRAGVRLADLAGIVVGTGPGAFTGLRVGLATAKTLAHELRCPVVGVSSAEALLAAVPGASELWLPSGPRDRIVVTPGQAPRIVHEAAEEMPDAPAATAPDRPVAVDLAGRAAQSALERGREAVAGLGSALLKLGATRLTAGEHDDPERLVPAYASPPRGVLGADRSEEVAWSRDPR